MSMEFRFCVSPAGLVNQLSDIQMLNSGGERLVQCTAHPILSIGAQASGGLYSVNSLLFFLTNHKEEVEKKA